MIFHNFLMKFYDFYDFFMKFHNFSLFLPLFVLFVNFLDLSYPDPIFSRTFCSPFQEHNGTGVHDTRRRGSYAHMLIV